MSSDALNDPFNTVFDAADQNKEQGPGKIVSEGEYLLDTRTISIAKSPIPNELRERCGKLIPSIAETMTKNVGPDGHIEFCIYDKEGRRIVNEQSTRSNVMKLVATESAGLFNTVMGVKNH